MSLRLTRTLAPAALLLPLVLAGQPAAAAGSDEPGRYVVVLHDEQTRGTAAPDPDTAAADARAAGAAVGHVYRHALRGYAATMDADTLAAVSADPRVRFVEPDATFHGSGGSEPTPWGLDRVDQRFLPLDGAYRYDTTGAGVTAYVIDSGIRLSHAEFSGRASLGVDLVDDGNTGDCAGHGTHVAGTLGGETYGVAKDVTLVDVRVLGCGNSTPMSRLIAGVDWVTANRTAGPAVVNMSINGPISTALTQAVRQSIAGGTPYVVSAGNYFGWDACTGSSGNVAEAIVVGASAPDDTLAEFSATGPCVDWVAPGQGVLSASHDGDTATEVMSGTSMAAPHTAGAVARLLQTDPGATPAAVEAYLASRTTKDVVTDPFYGSGTYDLLYVTPPVTRAVHGRITITRTAMSRYPVVEVTGDFASGFDCATGASGNSVTCTPKPVRGAAWVCGDFLVSASAPAPKDVGKGYVSTRLTCDGRDELATKDVVGLGYAEAYSWAPRIDLGTANTVTCTAAGVDGEPEARGSYQAVCDSSDLVDPTRT
jgi:subtilisin family serine protease